MALAILCEKITSHRATEFPVTFISNGVAPIFYFERSTPHRSEDDVIPSASRGPQHTPGQRALRGGARDLLLVAFRINTCGSKEPSALESTLTGKLGQGVGRIYFKSNLKFVAAASRPETDGGLQVLRIKPRRMNTYGNKGRGLQRWQLEVIADAFGFGFGTPVESRKIFRIPGMRDRSAPMV
jgi:hypothetical protein